MRGQVNGSFPPGDDVAEQQLGDRGAALAARVPDVQDGRHVLGRPPQVQRPAVHARPRPPAFRWPPRPAAARAAARAARATNATPPRRSCSATPRPRPRPRRLPGPARPPGPARRRRRSLPDPAGRCRRTCRTSTGTSAETGRTPGAYATSTGSPTLPGDLPARSRSRRGRSRSTTDRACRAWSRPADRCTAMEPELAASSGNRSPSLRSRTATRCGGDAGSVAVGRVVEHLAGAGLVDVGLVEQAHPQLGLEDAPDAGIDGVLVDVAAGDRLGQVGVGRVRDRHLHDRRPAFTARAPASARSAAKPWVTRLRTAFASLTRKPWKPQPSRSTSSSSQWLPVAGIPLRSM